MQHIKYKHLQFDFSVNLNVYEYCKLAEAQKRGKSETKYPCFFFFSVVVLIFFPQHESTVNNITVETLILSNQLKTETTV